MKIKPLLLIIAGLVALFLSLILIRSESLLVSWSVEDGLVEYLSGLFWLLGAIFSFLYFHKTSGGIKWLFLFFGFFYFFCFGEEISWGQRIFNYSVESIESRSNQEEFNLHNLDVFSKDSFYDGAREGRINPLLLFNTQNIFRLAYLIFFGAFPLMLWTGKPRSWRAALRGRPPFLLFLLSAWSVHLFIWIIRFMMNTAAREHMNEVEELWSALFAMLFIWTILQPGKDRASAAIEKG